jgi:L-lysine 2,3-aminomutase
MAESIRDPAELCRLLGLDPALATDATTAADGFSLLVPRPYLARIRPGDPADPLLLQVLPQAAETAVVPGYEPDPLREFDAQCAPGLLRKYQGRLLMVTTGECAVHCRFCFRRHFSCAGKSVEQPICSVPSTPHCNGGAVHSDGSIENTAYNHISPSALQKIADDDSVQEIILSGGDPLMLSDNALSDLVDKLGEIPHLSRLRIHSRLPVMIPQRVTGAFVASLRGGRLPIIMVVHINHPNEIDRPVADSLGYLIDAGIPVLNQSVLLRGVNDRVDVLAELYRRLVDLRVVPYYLHQLDPVASAAHFEVPIAVGKTLMAKLRGRLPGYAVPRYVRETPGGNCKEILA